MAFNQHFREATIADKEEVLSIRKNVYNGMDYLPAYYEYFIDDIHRRCFVGTLDSKIVSFVVMMPIDGGQSLVRQAVRVHEQYEGKRFFSALSQYVNNQYREKGFKHILSLVESTQYTMSETLKRTHTEIASKLQYVRIVTEDTRTCLMKNVHKLISPPLCGFKELQSCDLRKYFESPTIRPVLFPEDRLIVDYIPYRVMGANVSLLNGRNTRFFSNVRQSGDGSTGLLTAGSWYTGGSLPSSYTIDIFGNDIDSLENHILIHLSQALSVFSGQFVLHLCVDQGDIAIALSEILEKTSGNVEGWISLNSILEEPFN